MDDYQRKVCVHGLCGLGDMLAQYQDATSEDYPVAHAALLEAEARLQDAIDELRKEASDGVDA